MSLASHISTIASAGGDVTGITSSFDQDDTPDSLQSAQTPALLHFPAGGLLEEETFGRGMWGIRHNVRVVLLYAAKGQKRLEDNIGAITTRINSYISEMRADTTLPECFRFENYSEPGTLEFAGIEYHGCTFTVSVLEHYGS